MLEDLYRVRNSCSRYSSQNEMIYDILAQVAQQGGGSRYQTHIVCEPVVLEGLHVLSCQSHVIVTQISIIRVQLVAEPPADFAQHDANMY